LPQNVFSCHELARFLEMLPQVYRPGESRSALEFEVIDICAGEDRRLAEQNRILLDEFELSKSACLHKPGFWLQGSV
jgi:hypothetical protein